MQPQRKLHIVSATPEPQPVILQVDPGKLIATVFITCVTIELGFVVADATINYAEWSELSPVRRFFNITREDGVASWFAVTQTWMEAVTLALLTWIAAASNQGRAKVAAWGILTAFFAYMAMDDGSKFHERIGSAFKDAAESGAAANEAALSLFPSYPWQLLFVPFFACVGLFMAVFLWREIEALGPRMMVAAAVGLMAAAVGLDFFEGMDTDHPLNLHTVIRDTWNLTSYDVSHFSKSIEETFEMLSNTLLWCVFLGRLRHMAPDLRFAFETGGDKE